MTGFNRHVRTAFLAVGFAGIAATALAQDDDTRRFTVHYSVTPKIGEGAAFIAATKAHAAWHREQGDSWEWNVYSVEFGPTPGRLYIRSSGHTMAEIGRYQSSDFARADAAHYQKTVLPHVASIEAQIARPDAGISALTGDPESWQLYELVHLKLRNGKAAAWRSAIAEIHGVLQKNEWPHPYLFSWLESGGPSPLVTLVLPRADWSDFDVVANPRAVVAEALGEDTASRLWQEWGDAVESSVTEIVRYRPELSVTGAES
ncbi:MAG: hypothetical protein D6807_09100 [Alphaproteobacteria bacterium]|nr:MAG: hypothetical protein D6807_09100 [Alphaproteobacteria bacterium]